MVLIAEDVTDIINDYCEISVPLRGLWFLSITKHLLLFALSTKFPSPCGDYGSYRLEWLDMEELDT